MADKVIVTKSKLTGLGDKIRAKTGSTTKMTIDAMNAALDNVGGGASVLVGYKGTAVPSSGIVGKVYFNTSLLVEEVNEILSSLDYVEGILDTPAYAIATTTDMSQGLVIMSGILGDGSTMYVIVTGDGKYIYQYLPGDPYTPLGFQYSEVDLNIDNMLSVLAPQVGMTIQNDKLKNLISITPFEKEIKTLSGEYDGSSITVTNKDVNMSELLDEGKLPKKIIVEDGLKKKIESSNTCYYLMLDYKGKDVDFLENVDTSKVKSFICMFSGNTYIETIPQLNTSSANNMNMMFYECQSLKTVPEMETENVFDMSYMFYNCKSLVSIPKLNTKNANNMRAMFYWCENLQTTIEMETGNVSNMRDMLYCCKKLTDVSLNMNKITVFNNALNFLGNCTNLTNLKLLNIRVTLQVGYGTSWGHLLTLDSLIGLCKECINTGSALTLTVGSANLEKIQNSGKFFKFVDPSVSEIAVGEKGEIEECDSSVTGSFSITDYMAMKNWTLA